MFYDVTCISGIEKMKNIVKQYNNNRTNDIRYILIGDLASEKNRQISFDEIQQFAYDN